VASRTRVIPEVVDIDKRGLGITVKPEDPGSLADAIILLLKDKALRQDMGGKGRDYVERERSWRIVAKRTQGIMEALRS